MELDANEVTRNMNAWTYEQLQPYLGKHVAWRLDGKAILAAAASPEELFERIDLSGLKQGEYILSYIPEPEPIEPPTILPPKDVP